MGSHSEAISALRLESAHKIRFLPGLRQFGLFVRYRGRAGEPLCRLRLTLRYAPGPFLSLSVRPTDVMDTAR